MRRSRIKLLELLGEKLEEVKRFIDELGKRMYEKTQQLINGYEHSKKTDISR
jgi:hypothetical protein